MYGINNILSSVSDTLTPPESLTGYGDVYIVTDLRKRGKKEPNDTKAYSKGFEWRKDKHNSYGNFTRDIFDLTKNKASYEKGNAVKNTDYVHIYARYNDGFLETPLPMFIPETLKGNEFRGYENNIYTRIDKNKVFNYLDDYPKLEGFITKEYYKDLFNQNIDYQIGLMNNRIKNYPQYKNESEKELKYFKLLYSNPTKYQLFSKTSGLNVTEKYRPEILENSNLIDAPVESPKAPETKKAQESPKNQKTESAPVESTEPEPTPEPVKNNYPIKPLKLTKVTFKNPYVVSYNLYFDDNGNAYVYFGILDTEFVTDKLENGFLIRTYNEFFNPFGSILLRPSEYPTIKYLFKTPYYNLSFDINNNEPLTCYISAIDWYNFNIYNLSEYLKTLKDNEDNKRKIETTNYLLRKYQSFINDIKTYSNQKTESAPESPAPETEIFNDAETVDIEKSPVTNANTPNWGAIENDMARAKQWASFDPEKSAKFETDYYKAVYNEVLKDVPADYVEQFNDIFNRKVYDVIRLQSKAPNAAVTGNGGVSASKARKYNAANDRLMETRAKFDDYIKYIARRLAAKARRNDFINSTPEQKVDARFNEIKKSVDSFYKLLQNRESVPGYSITNARQNLQSKIENEAYKGNVELVEKLLEYMRPLNVYTNRSSIWNLAEIARKKRANYDAAEKQLEEQNADENADYQIYFDTNEDRVKIYFNSIPSENIRNWLKHRNFKWSPKNKAWQRQITTDTRYVVNEFNKLYKEGTLQGLGKPTIKFEFNNNDELKAFLNDNKENLIDSYIDADIADDAPLNAKKIAVNGVGNPPAGIFNCPESELICNGFVPTYQRLDDYSHLIDTAENNNVLKGYGFDDTTLNTLIDAVKHYKQVARLAEHLKADTPEQTAFNIWHWLHCNIAYNYDTQGKEEIRTPARTWSDRKSGVDCDCLSVFTAALLINLGYHPKFEIVAFANKPQFSHIYVNLDGLAIDRVLPTFNRRPMLITKTMLMDIPVYQLNGLSGINAELQGVYENALRRYAHTQDGEDLLNMRKTQILVSLQGSDYNGFRLAGLLMPYVQGIDDEGGYYFDNEEIANIAANADNDVIAAEMRGASEQELGKLFKKIGKALKKAAKKVGSAVKAVAKTTAKAVTTVAKTTAKATKAAVKSAVNTVKATANVVKAGAQAVTGKGSAAKATLKKAGQQVKAAVVQPVKTAVQNTKAVVKNVVVEPTKTAVKVTIVEPTKTLVKAVAKTIKIAGKIFKVILVKINPITVLMRNSLRLLVAVNFLGMATRLNVANMTQAAAIAAGYTAAQWNDAKKAYDRVIKFFTKMGGKRENIEKSIVNGAKKKALFKKDYKLNSQIIEKGSDDATLSGTGVILNGLDGLGAAVTIGSALAAVGAFFKTIWKWLCKVVPKAAKATVNVIKKVAQNDDVKKIATAAKDAAVNKAVESVTKKIGGNTTTPTTPTTPDILPPDTTPKKSNRWLKWALLAAAGVTVVGLAASGKKKRKKAA